MYHMIKNAKKIYNLKSITGIASEWVNDVYIFSCNKKTQSVCSPTHSKTGNKRFFSTKKINLNVVFAGENKMK